MGYGQAPILSAPVLPSGLVDNQPANGKIPLSATTVASHAGQQMQFDKLIN